ncbi:MAG TPA: PHP domain-containing protein, partial [Candidatus Sulfotelmatobacter sp.]|nr:PHP domain-containing protein [Candidatus Sulfotelmatobacter sp.]
VHTEWSYDAPRGDMARACERALEIGLPAIAFTDHADFVVVHEGQHCVDIAGYQEAVERCRSRYPNLRILSGVELGEPHWFPIQTAEILAAGPLDRVLGSIHCIRLGGRIVDASQFHSHPPEDLPGAVRDYFRETVAMIESAQPFEALAHIDYPKRYWPDGAAPYREEDFEEEIRAVLSAAQKRGLVLEINTTRGGEDEARFSPGLKVLRWWHDLGGDAVSFGSDAHDPDQVAGGFEVAMRVVEAAGFKPAADPMALWRR